MANFSNENNQTKMILPYILFKRGTTEQLKTSSYVPFEGELVMATDAALLKVGNGTSTLAELGFIGGVAVEDSYTSTATTKGLSAAKGKDLNDRIEAFRNITTIDCGELPVEETEETEEQSGE